MRFIGIKIKTGGMLNKIIALLLLLFFSFFGKSYSQKQYKIAIANIYKELDNPPPVGVINGDLASVTGYAPDANVLEIWQKILSSPQFKYSSFLNSISLQKSSINNFWSTNTEGQNIIFYDAVLFKQFEGLSMINTSDLIEFSLLHELGHFMNHDIENHKKSKTSEVNADRFACGILCDMKFSKNQVLNVMQTIGSPATDELYPNKGERLRFIDSFFTNNGCNNNDIVTNTVSNPGNNKEKPLSVSHPALYYYNQAIYEYDQKKYDQTILFCDTAISLNQAYTDAYIYRGIANDNLGKEIEAIDDYTKAISLKPDYAIAYDDRGLAKYRLGKYAESIDDYTKAISLKPGYADAYYNRGLAKYRLGKYAESIDDYTKSIELKPDYTDAYYNRGLAKKQLGKYAESIDDYTKAIELKPDDADAYC